MLVIGIIGTLLTTAILLPFYFFQLPEYKKDSINNNNLNVSIYSDKTHGKIPLYVNLSAQDPYKNNGKFEYIWDFGNNQKSNLKNPSYIYDEIGEYTVELTIKDEYGNTGQNFLTIYAFKNEPPIVSISADKISGRAPLTIQFQSEGIDEDGSIKSYEWDFDEKSIVKNRESDEQNPSHTYYLEGTYCIRCTVTDDDGDTDTVMIKIDVKPRLIATGLQIYFMIYRIWNNILKPILNK